MGEGDESTANEVTLNAFYADKNELMEEGVLTCDGVFVARNSPEEKDFYGIISTITVPDMMLGATRSFSSVISLFFILIQPWLTCLPIDFSLFVP